MSSLKILKACEEEAELDRTTPFSSPQIFPGGPGIALIDMADTGVRSHLKEEAQSENLSYVP